MNDVEREKGRENVLVGRVRRSRRRAKVDLMTTDHDQGGMKRTDCVAE